MRSHLRKLHLPGEMRLASLTLLFSTLLLFGCRPQRAGQVIARVGEAELTLEEAKTHIDTTRIRPEYALTDYVSYWVNTELLYQEAKRRGVENSPEFIRQLQDVRRQLANQAFLERDVYSDTAEVTDKTMRQYFTQHAAEFQVREHTLKLNLVVFNSRERANVLAAAVSRGTDWKSAVDNLLRDSIAGSSVLSVISGHYYTEQTLFPPELWKVASALSVDEVSFPVYTAGGYFVLQSLARLEQGAPAPFELAGSEVRRRFLIEVRRRQYDDLLGNLRKKTNVELLLGSHRMIDTVHAQE